LELYIEVSSKLKVVLSFNMAASAKMSFNYYQNGKYGTLPANPQKDSEITQDMHLKMSKKIAQLTKVCFLERFC